MGPGVFVTTQPQTARFDVLLVGHLDTVFPAGTVAERPMSRDENRLYGPGVADMKSGLLNILWAMRTLPAEHRQRLAIAVAMNPDEETGSVHSHRWICELAKRSNCVLVCEAARADGSLVNARKGMAGFHLEFTGVAAHAGNEPEKARAELDVRFWENAEYDRIHQALIALCEKGFLDGVSTTLTRVHHKPAMAASDATRALMQQVEQAGKEEGIPVTWQAVGGGSDANHTAALGIPTLDGLGPVGAGFHSPTEWLDIASIEPRIRLLRRVISML